MTLNELVKLAIKDKKLRTEFINNPIETSLRLGIPIDEAFEIDLELLLFVANKIHERDHKGRQDDGN